MATLGPAVGALLVTMLAACSATPVGTQPSGTQPAATSPSQAASSPSQPTTASLPATPSQPATASQPGTGSPPGTGSQPATGSGPATGSRPATGSGPAWFVTRAALTSLIADQGAKARLLGAQIYEILRPGQKPVAGVPARPVVTFASATTLKQAVAAGQIPPGTYGVMYDPEAWSFTPVAEQRDPVAAAASAASVAHAHGLRFIVAPALNLTTVLAPDSSAPRWRRFLDLDLVAQLARVADIVELQAQSLERDATTYRTFVHEATAQATAANSRVVAIAGLSTNPPGITVSGANLVAAIAATRTLVTGYWLNIPGLGAQCPTCGPANPAVAISTLRQLS